MSETIKVIVEAAERLFGKLGFALFLATGAFFLLPASLLIGIGIPAADLKLREVLGLIFLLSAATCVVTTLIYLRPVWAHLADRFARRAVYSAIPMEGRVILSRFSELGQSAFFAPRDYEPVQRLVDQGLVHVVEALGELRLILSNTGIRLVAEYRAELRADGRENPAVAREVARLVRSQADINAAERI